MPPAAERRLFWITAGTVLLLDAVTKVIAEASLLRGAGVTVIGDWFQLRLVYNQGAAFGLHLGPFSGSWRSVWSPAARPGTWSTESRVDAASSTSSTSASGICAGPPSTSPTWP